MEHLLFLKEILQDELKACGELLALSEQEKDAVIKNEVKAISVIVQKKQSALGALQKHQAKRDSLLAGMTLKETARCAQGSLRKELQGLVEELEAMAKKLRRVNTLNKTLIDMQMQYTSLCINLITGRESTPGTYSGSGHKHDGCAVSPCLVDQTI